MKRGTRHHKTTLALTLIIITLIFLTIMVNADPAYSLFGVNTTLANSTAKFYSYWTDGTALHPTGGYIFSTNNTGSWINDTWTAFSTTPSWANLTKTLNETEGTVIGYRWYANDTSNNWNQTAIYSLTTNTSSIGLEIIYPTSNINISQNNFFNYTINVTCLTGSCGEVNVSLALLTGVGSDVNASTYCSNTGGDTSYGEYIDRVVFNEIDYTSGDNEGYLDATSNITLLTLGTTYELNVTLYVDDGYTDYVVAFFDWNQDQVFSETTERYEMGGTATDGTVISKNITVPVGAAPGPTMFRLVAEYGENELACNAPDYNEVEDYSLYIDVGGLINTTTGAIPFYTNMSTNPYNISISEGESEVVTFWVNATAGSNTFNFYSYVNLTSNMSKSNQTQETNVTIYRLNELEVELISPLDGEDYTYEATQYFVANLSSNPFTSIDLKNATLYVWDREGLYNFSTTEITGTKNNSNMTIELSSFGENYWNYYLCDIGGNCAFGDENYSIYYCGGRTDFEDEMSLLCGANASWYGENSGDNLEGGSYVGDINNDGYSDFILYSEDNSYGGSDTGSVYLFYGNTNTFSGTMNVNESNASWYGAYRKDDLGRGTSYAGDINGDGYDDLLIPSYGYTSVAKEGIGRTNLIYGRETIFSGRINVSTANASWSRESIESSENTLAEGIGDFNGDGYDDFVIDHFRDDYGGDSAGQTYLILGSPISYAGNYNVSEVNASWYGAKASDWLGYGTSYAGDINNDGYDDLLLTSPMGIYDSGQIYLVYGSSNGFSMRTNVSDVSVSWYGEADGDWARSASSGDINGDGIADIIFYSGSNDYGASGAGQTYLIFGSPISYAGNYNVSSANASWYGERSGDSLSSNSFIGDVNGDGWDDLFMGNYRPDLGSVGEVQLVYGSPTGLSMRTSISNANASWIGEYEDDGAYEMDGLGDINNDGYDDFVIDSTNNDYGANDAGRIYLIYGTGEDFVAKTISTIKITDESDYTGSDNSGIVYVNINDPLYVNIAATGGDPGIKDIITVLINSTDSSIAVPIKAYETGINTNEYHGTFRVRTGASHRLSKKIRAENTSEIYVQTKDNSTISESVTIYYGSNIEQSISPTTTSSSGGSISTTQSNKIETIINVWSKMEANKKYDLNIDKEKIAINKITLKLKNSKINSRIEVSSINNLLDMPKPKGKIYQYLIINTKNIDNKEISKAIIEFKISSSWFDEKFKPESVKILRYSSEWEKLETNFLNKDSDYAYYETITPGFSYFAIVGYEEEVEKLTEEKTSKPTRWTPGITAIIILLIILIFKIISKKKMWKITKKRR
jgi:PGF-pre-PGF domain-containing protein